MYALESILHSATKKFSQQKLFKKIHFHLGTSVSICKLEKNYLKIYYLIIYWTKSELNLKKDQIVISLWDPKQIEKNLKKKINAQKVNYGFLGQITLRDTLFEKFLDNGSE